MYSLKLRNSAWPQSRSSAWFPQAKLKVCHFSAFPPRHIIYHFRVTSRPVIVHKHTCSRLSILHLSYNVPWCGWQSQAEWRMHPRISPLPTFIWRQKNSFLNLTPGILLTNNGCRHFSSQRKLWTNVFRGALATSPTSCLDLRCDVLGSSSHLEPRRMAEVQPQVHWVAESAPLTSSIFSWTTDTLPWLGQNSWSRLVAHQSKKPQCSAPVSLLFCYSCCFSLWSWLKNLT